MTFPEESSRPWRQWFAAAAQPQVSEQLVALYVRLDQAIARHGPVCWASGLCCHFDAFGHRLYVTGLEIAWLLRHVAPPSGPIDIHAACPFQADHRCTVHPVRPLGCRVFFCQRGTESWQQVLYEQFLAELRQLHQTHDLTYHYLEWRVGLSEAVSHPANPAAAAGD